MQPRTLDQIQLDIHCCRSETWNLCMSFRRTPERVAMIQKKLDSLNNELESKKAMLMELQS